MAYSRNVLRVGPVGAGQLAKACNNLLHWVHCVSNYETLLLAKRFGVDAQQMREVLLECPAFNLTLEALGHHQVHLAGKGHGRDHGPGPAGRAGAAAGGR